MNDAAFMRSAIACARRGEGLTRPNPPVGAVVVKNGKIIGRGFHLRAGTPHAEVNAISSCRQSVAGATLYVTLEPCSTVGRTPACTDLVIRSKIARVVYGCDDPNPRHAGRAAEVLSSHGIAVTRGILEKQCRELITPFAFAMLQHRPHVTVKLATTIDGRIADRNGSSRWISSPASRGIVQEMRRKADAVIVGSQTAISDNPSLLCHKPGARQNSYRVVVDSQGRIPATLQILTDDHAERTVVATTRNGAAALRQKCPSARFSIWQFPKKTLLADLMSRLTAELDVMQVLCEGGGGLAGALAENGLFDELVVFQAPIVLGDDGACPAFSGMERLLPNAARFSMSSARRVGPDIMLKWTSQRRDATW